MSDRIQPDMFSRCAVPLTLHCNGHEFATASGFFWAHEGRIFLISNWHVFSGREPWNGQPKNSQLAVPDVIGVTYYHGRTGDLCTIRISVLHEDKPVWIQHEKYGQNVDVAAIDVTDEVADSLTYETGEENKLFCINTLPQIDEAYLRVTDDLYILGFPLGLRPTAALPIWKRASVASEPDFPVNGLSCFYVDTASREGMSGAPVLLRATSYQTKTASRTRLPGITQFVGVYSGRATGRDHEAQLGLIWKKELLDEILQALSPGHWVLR